MEIITATAETETDKIITSFLPSGGLHDDGLLKEDQVV
jgi:hypothetical protein